MAGQLDGAFGCRFGTAVVTALLLGLTVGGAAFLTEPDEMKQLFGRLKEVLHRRKSGRS